MTSAFLAMLFETLITIAFVVAIAVLLKKLLARAGGARRPDGREVPDAGGWSDLARRFADDRPIAEPVARAASIKVGSTMWKNCAAIGVEEAGLRLAVRVPLLGGFGKAPLLVPWSEIVEVVPAHLFWGAARRLVIGRPTLATVTLPEAVFEAILARGHLAR
ncbi:MAG: hypothetical protein GX458_03465 [Phyllobacteriaceae bacterium]|nr:hypothetical protein [Phyllobacteriaceae bacterium]